MASIKKYPLSWIFFLVIGGDYAMFEAADVVLELDRSYFDLAVEFIQKNHPVRVATSSTFTVYPLN
jgi:hypothetical protein